jgi:hypothetical protein
MSGTKKLEAARMTVGAGRIAWQEIDPPLETPEGLRYKMTLLLPPAAEADAKRITAACLDLWQQKYGTDPKEWPANARTPDKVVRPCSDKPTWAGYEKGWFFFACSSAEEAGDRQRRPRSHHRHARVCNGRWAKISVRPFLCSIKGLGVSLGLSTSNSSSTTLRLLGAPARLEDLMFEGGRSQVRVLTARIRAMSPLTQMTLYWDCETRSTVDLRRADVPVHLCEPPHTTAVTVAHLALDQAREPKPVEWRWEPRHCPTVFVTPAMEDHNVRVVAHNAAFEEDHPSRDPRPAPRPSRFQSPCGGGTAPWPAPASGPCPAGWRTSPTPSDWT